MVLRKKIENLAASGLKWANTCCHTKFPGDHQLLRYSSLSVFYVVAFAIVDFQKLDFFTVQ